MDSEEAEINQLLADTSLVSTESDSESETDLFAPLAKDKESDGKDKEPLVNNQILEDQQQDNDENENIRENTENVEAIAENETLNVGESQTEKSLRAERKARLKNARNIRFKTGESDNSLQVQETIENPTSSTIETNKMESELIKEIDEIELLFDEEDYDDEDDDMLKTPRGDTIKAKMEFLKFFEIPSLSDISEDTEEK